MHPSKSLTVDIILDDGRIDVTADKEMISGAPVITDQQQHEWIIDRDPFLSFFVWIIRVSESHAGSKN